MSILASEKRILAENCILLSIEKNFEQAARVRQEAYARTPPGSIGVDWEDWDEVWSRDSRYIKFMLREDYSDCDNSRFKVEFMQSGIFVDYLFDFKDCWGVRRQAELSDETFHSDLLERYLANKNWTFECENREIIYTNTKKKNISARIYYEAINKNGMHDIAHPQIFAYGEYDLGFSLGTPQNIIEARRHWLERYDLFLKMQAAKIEKFPKTFQTFEKHVLSNSKKYQEWIQQYSSLSLK